MPFPRRIAVLGAIAIVVVLAAVAAWLRVGPRSEADRQAAADDLVAGIHVSVTVTGSTLAATQAIADFGVGQEVRLVLVRVVEAMTLAVGVRAERDVAFAEAPRFCLVGPFSAPDDAGLEDPCWGEPDLGSLAGGSFSVGEAGYPFLAAGESGTMTTELRRGDVRCDYPPGGWALELRVDPIVDGAPAGPRYASAAPFEVPLEAAESPPLLLLERARYCGLASQVYREQGEPAVASPGP